jgi:hypothetical protein
MFRPSKEAPQDRRTYRRVSSSSLNPGSPVPQPASYDHMTTRETSGRPSRADLEWRESSYSRSEPWSQFPADSEAVDTRRMREHISSGRDLWRGEDIRGIEELEYNQRYDEPSSFHSHPALHLHNSSSSHAPLEIKDRPHARVQQDWIGGSSSHSSHDAFDISRRDNALGERSRALPTPSQGARGSQDDRNWLAGNRYSSTEARLRDSKTYSQSLWNTKSPFAGIHGDHHEDVIGFGDMGNTSPHANSGRRGGRWAEEEDREEYASNNHDWKRESMQGHDRAWRAHRQGSSGGDWGVHEGEQLRHHHTDMSMPDHEKWDSYKSSRDSRDVRDTPGHAGGWPSAQESDRLGETRSIGTTAVAAPTSRQAAHHGSQWRSQRASSFPLVSEDAPRHLDSHDEKRSGCPYGSTTRHTASADETAGTHGRPTSLQDSTIFQEVYRADHVNTSGDSFVQSTATNEHQPASSPHAHAHYVYPHRRPAADSPSMQAQLPPGHVYSEGRRHDNPAQMQQLSLEECREFENLESTILLRGSGQMQHNAAHAVIVQTQHGAELHRNIMPEAGSQLQHRNLELCRHNYSQNADGISVVASSHHFPAQTLLPPGTDHDIGGTNLPVGSMPNSNSMHHSVQPVKDAMRGRGAAEDEGDMDMDMDIDDGQVISVAKRAEHGHAGFQLTQEEHYDAISQACIQAPGMQFRQEEFQSTMLPSKAADEDHGTPPPPPPPPPEPEPPKVSQYVEYFEYLETQPKELFELIAQAADTFKAEDVAEAFRVLTNIDKATMESPSLGAAASEAHAALLKQLTAVLPFMSVAQVAGSMSSAVLMRLEPTPEVCESILTRLCEVAHEMEVASMILIFKSWRPLGLRKDGAVLDAMLMRCAVRAESFEAQEMSMILTVLFRMTVAPPASLVSAWLRTSKLDHYLDVHCVANALWATAVSGAEMPPNHVILGWLQFVSSSSDELTSEDVCKVFFSIVRVNVDMIKPLLNELTAGLSDAVETFDAHCMLTLFWSLGHIGQSVDTTFLKRISAHAAAQASTFMATEVSQILWACARINATVSETFMPSLVAQAQNELHTLDMQAIMQILWACHTLGWAPDEASAAAISTRVQQLAPELDPPSIASLVWFLAKLKLAQKGPLFEELTKQALLQKDAWLPPAISHFLSAFALAGFAPEPSLASMLCTRACESSDSIESLHITSILRAFAELRLHPDGALVDTFKRRIIAAPLDLSASDVAYIFKYFTVLKLRINRGMLRAFLTSSLHIGVEGFNADCTGTALGSLIKLEPCDEVSKLSVFFLACAERTIDSSTVQQLVDSALSIANLSVDTVARATFLEKARQRLKASIPDVPADSTVRMFTGLSKLGLDSDSFMVQALMNRAKELMHSFSTSQLVQFIDSLGRFGLIPDPELLSSFTKYILPVVKSLNSTAASSVMVALASLDFPSEGKQLLEALSHNALVVFSPRTCKATTLSDILWSCERLNVTPPAPIVEAISACAVQMCQNLQPGPLVKALSAYTSLRGREGNMVCAALMDRAKSLVESFSVQDSAGVLAAISAAPTPAAPESLILMLCRHITRNMHHVEPQHVVTVFIALVDIGYEPDLEFFKAVGARVEHLTIAMPSGVDQKCIAVTMWAHAHFGIVPADSVVKVLCRCVICMHMCIHITYEYIRTYTYKHTYRVS